MKGRSPHVVVAMAIIGILVVPGTSRAATKKKPLATTTTQPPAATTTQPPAATPLPFQDLTSDQGASLTAVSVVATSSFDLAKVTDVTKKCQPERVGALGSSTVCMVTGWLATPFAGDMEGDATFALSGVTNDPTGRSLSPAGNTVFVGKIKGCGTGALIFASSPTFVDTKYQPIVPPGLAAQPPYRVEIQHFGRYGDFIGIEGEGIVLPQSPKPDGSVDLQVLFKLRCIAH